MLRRDFIKLSGLGAAGLLLPQARERLAVLTLPYLHLALDDPQLFETSSPPSKPRSPLRLPLPSRPLLPLRLRSSPRVIASRSACR